MSGKDELRQTSIKLYPKHFEIIENLKETSPGGFNLSSFVRKKLEELES